MLLMLITGTGQRKMLTLGANLNSRWVSCDYDVLMVLEMLFFTGTFHQPHY